MNKTTEKIISITTKHGLIIIGAFCFITLVISGSMLILEGIDLIAGRFISSLTPSQMYGFTVIALGLMLMLIGERAYRLLASAGNYVKMKKEQREEVP